MKNQELLYGMLKKAEYSKDQTMMALEFDSFVGSDLQKLLNSPPENMFKGVQMCVVTVTVPLEYVPLIDEWYQFRVIEDEHGCEAESWWDPETEKGYNDPEHFRVGLPLLVLDDGINEALRCVASLDRIPDASIEQIRKALDVS